MANAHSSDLSCQTPGPFSTAAADNHMCQHEPVLLKAYLLPWENICVFVFEIHSTFIWSPFQTIKHVNNK